MQICTDARSGVINLQEGGREGGGDAKKQWPFLLTPLLIGQNKKGRRAVVKHLDDGGRLGGREVAESAGVTLLRQTPPPATPDEDVWRALRSRRRRRET